MARYIKDFYTTANSQTIHFSINQYLQNEGYEYTQYEGEYVFKKGNGILTNPTFFKFSYMGNAVRMETWMKYALLPGVYVGELGVDGFIGCAVKGPWKKRIQQLENILSTYAMQNPVISTTVNYASQNIEQLNRETVASNYNSNYVSTKFCNNCGTKIPANSIFCSGCGNKIV